jgi:hypothetical protein
LATNKDQTFTIKDVMGISRYYSSTNTPPNKFYTLTNVYSPQRGALESINGYEEITPSIPNLDQVIDISYLDQSLGEQQWLTHYSVPTSQTFDAPPATGWTFTQPTGAGATFSRTVYAQYVYQCGTTRKTDLGAQTFKTLTGRTYVDITIPTSTMPTNLYCINFLMDDEYPATRIWMGSIMRKNGVFPPTSSAENTIRCYMSATSVSATANNSSFGDVSPTGFTFTPTTVAGGNLDGNRIYYFSICPWLQQQASFTNRLNKCAMFIGGATGGGRFAAYLPSGYNALDITFTGAPTSTGPTTPTPVTYYIILAGKTPEEMAPIGNALIHQALPVTSSGTPTARVMDMPYNTNMAMSMATMATSNGDFAGTAIANRIYGNLFYMETIAYPIISDDRTYRIGLASHQFPYDSTTHKEMLPGLQMTFTADQTFATLTSWRASYSTASSNYNDKGFVYGWNMGSSTSVRSAPYADKQLFVNGYSNVYLSNGDLAIPLAGDDIKRIMPITTNISVFKDRLILGCGPVNFSYDKGIVHYSDAAVITNFGTGAGNFLNMNFGDSSELVGFGSFSQDLANVGPSTFLGIGKTNSTYTWNGGTTAADQQLVLVGKALGWLSPDSYALTKDGPVVATPQGLYTLNGTEMKELDAGTQFIYTSASTIKLIYTEDRVIVLSGGEYWYDFRNEPDGGLVMVTTGPHSVPSYSDAGAFLSPTGMVNAFRYGNDRNYRITWTNSDTDRFGGVVPSKVYRMEVPNRGLMDDTGAVMRSTIRLNSTGLGADEFIKRIRAIYFDLAISQFTGTSLSAEFVVIGQDGASIGDNLDVSDPTKTYSMVSSLPAVTSSQSQYRKYQLDAVGFTNLLDPTETIVKPRGTIFGITFDLIPNEAGMVFNMRSLSFLFNIERRRRV